MDFWKLGIYSGKHLKACEIGDDAWARLDEPEKLDVEERGGMSEGAKREKLCARAEPTPRTLSPFRSFPTRESGPPARP